MIKAKDLRPKTVEDLEAQLSSLSEEHAKLRFQHGIRPLENTAKLKTLRRDIARVKTVINEKLAV
ncbi:MAG: 50S ribosomal protein L29 [Desulfurivibrionaceae bacterium]